MLSSAAAVFSPNPPIWVQANPARIATTSTCNRSPPVKAPMKVSGIRFIR